MTRMMLHFVTAAAVALLLAACSSGTEAPETRQVEVSGQVLAPGGSDPLAGATVFVSDSLSTEVLAGQAEEDASCDAPDEADAAAGWGCTDADGNFSFSAELAGSSALLTVTKGSWHTAMEISVRGSEAAVGTIEMPTEAAPRIAVVTGEYDDMAGVLDRMGLADSYDLYGGDSFPGSEADWLELFAEDSDTDRPLIFSYDLVFFNCGIYALDDIGEDNWSTLEQFVSEGGSMYATDWASELVTGAFPDYLEFRPVDGAGMNSLQAQILDSTLADWLSGRTCVDGDCIASGGSLEIGEMLAEWSILDGPQATPEGESVKIWVEGNIGTAADPDIVPLTATFRHGAGRVLFTSYHSSPSAPTEGFLPQERVLEYLVFEL